MDETVALAVASKSGRQPTLLGIEWLAATTGVACVARLVHAGRTTQGRDAEVRHEVSGRPVALFRCRQLLIYPKTA